MPCYREVSRTGGSWQRNRSCTSVFSIRFITDIIRHREGMDADIHIHSILKNILVNYIRAVGILFIIKNILIRQEKR